MKLQKIFSIILICFITFQFNQAHADSEAPPRDYAIISADKNYIFVMLVPEEEIMQAWEYIGEEPTFYSTYIFETEISIEQFQNAEQKLFSLRTKYPCSGLYKNDGSNIPIWTVEWYAYYVYLFPDSEHLIRHGPWNRSESDENGGRSFNGLAYAFYKNGVEVAKYSVKDIVKDTNAISFSVSHYMWEKDFYINKSTGILYVETLDNQKYSYDVREMAKSVSNSKTVCIPNYKFSPYPIYVEYLPIFVALIAMLGVIFFYLQRIRKQRRMSQND
jgi:hypothetical protein